MALSTKKHSVLNLISKILASTTLMIVSIYTIYVVESEFNPINKEYNSVDIQSEFKKYRLLDKYEQDESYLFILENPITKGTKKIKVASYIYYNLYFVGDIIK